MSAAPGPGGPSPIRVIHFADAHIGVESHSRTVTVADLDALPPTFAPGVDRRAMYSGLPSRLIDSLRALDELVAFALQDPPVDLVIFAGDAYRSREPSQTHQREFARRIARLASAGVAVVLVAGNHDIPNRQGRAGSMEIFETLAVDGVIVASRPGVYTAPTRKGPVQVAALPWLRRSAVMTQSDLQGKTFDQINDWMQAYLTGAIRNMAESVDPAAPAFLAAHATVSTAQLGAERTLMVGHDYVLLPGTMQDPRFDYVALGHIHHHQVISPAPPVVYSGSLHRVDFAEENDPKGFCVIEIDPAAGPGERVIGWSFQEVWSRRFVTIRVNVTETDPDPLAAIRTQIEKRDVTDAVVRVEVRVPLGTEGLIDGNAVRSLLAGAHVVAGVSVHSAQPNRSRTRLDRGLPVEQLEPMDALEMYLDSRSTPAGRRATLLQYAARITEAESDSGHPPENQPTGLVTVRMAETADMDDAFALRRRVFIDEQNVDPDEEWDGLDETAVHAIATADGVVVGTGRLLLPDGATEARIGRMAVDKDQRRNGTGRQILLLLEQEAVAKGADTVLLHAQTYVKAFYAGMGYQERGARFMEAGIEHVEMVKALQTAADDTGELPAEDGAEETVGT